MGVGRRRPPRVDRGAHRSDRARRRGAADAGPVAGGGRDGGAHARPPERRTVPAGPGCLGAPGGGGMARSPVRRADRTDPRVRRYRPERLAAGGTRDRAGAELPAAAPRWGRQGAEAQRPPPPVRRPHLPRRDGPDERRPRRRDRRRVDPVPVLARTAGGVRGRGRRRIEQTRTRPRRPRRRADGAGRVRFRPGCLPGRAAAAGRAVRRRDGIRGRELLQGPRDPLRVRRARERHPGGVPRRTPDRGSGPGPRRDDRRALSGRLGRARPRAPRRLAVGGRDDAAREGPKRPDGTRAR